jgi:hypothetical protein
VGLAQRDKQVMAKKASPNDERGPLCSTTYAPRRSDSVGRFHVSHVDVAFG